MFLPERGGRIEVGGWWLVGWWLVARLAKLSAGPVGWRLCCSCLLVPLAGALIELGDGQLV